MKIKAIFEEEKIGNDIVMVSLNNEVLNGIIHANETAHFIISCLKEETDLETIISKVRENYGISYKLASSAVNKTISQLRVLNLIEE